MYERLVHELMNSDNEEHWFLMGISISPEYRG